MEKGIDKLTGELAELAKELSKAVPKGYAELVREYSVAHQLEAGKNLVKAVVLLLIIIVAIVLVIKIARQILNVDSLPIDDRWEALAFFGALSGFVIAMLIMALSGELNGFIYELQRALAPNYYMLHQLIK